MQLGSNGAHFLLEQNAVSQRRSRWETTQKPILAESHPLKRLVF